MRSHPEQTTSPPLMVRASQAPRRARSRHRRRRAVAQRRGPCSTAAHLGWTGWTGRTGFAARRLNASELLPRRQVLGLGSLEEAESKLDFDGWPHCGQGEEYPGAPGKPIFHMLQPLCIQHLTELKSVNEKKFLAPSRENSAGASSSAHVCLPEENPEQGHNQLRVSFLLQETAEECSRATYRH